MSRYMLSTTGSRTRGAHARLYSSPDLVTSKSFENQLRLLCGEPGTALRPDTKSTAFPPRPSVVIRGFHGEDAEARRYIVRHLVESCYEIILSESRNQSALRTKYTVKFECRAKRPRPTSKTRLKEHPMFGETDIMTNIHVGLPLVSLQAISYTCC